MNIYKNYLPLSDKEEMVAKIIVQSALEVHRRLGPGLLENVYETCFCYELKKKGIANKRQVALPIQYDGRLFDEGLRLDVYVDELVICELKARETINILWPAQLISHLKLAKCRLGYLINFNVPLIKDGIRRFII